MRDLINLIESKSKVLKEYAPPASGPLADLAYLLKNAPVSDEVLAQAIAMASKESAEQPELAPAAPQPQQPVAQQPVQQTPAPKVADLPQPEIPGEEGLEPEQIQEARAKKSHADEIAKLAPSCSPELQARILYMIKMDAYKGLTDDLVTKKIKGKVDTIRPLVHEKIEAMGKTVDVKHMIDFLKICLATGTINVPNMIKKSTPPEAGVPIPIVKPEFNDIFLGLCDINPGSAAALGKGEVALSLTGINTVKAESDIKVGTKDIELKTTLKGSDFFLKGAKGYGKKVSDALGKLVARVNSVGATHPVTKEPIKNINASKDGGISQLNDKWIKILNPSFQQIGQKEVQKLLYQVVQDVFSEQSISSAKAAIYNSVSETGEVDYTAFALATAQVAFNYYKYTSGHDGILMLNVDNLTYSFQLTDESFVDLARTGILKQTSAIDFRNSALGAPTFKFNVNEKAVTKTPAAPRAVSAPRQRRGV